MRIINPVVILAAVLFTCPAIAAAQPEVQELEAPEGATIASARVTGFDLFKLSPGLQAAIAGLAGRPVDREQLRELAARIEAELPECLATARAVQDPDGEVRVVFEVVPVSPGDSDANINDRYVIEDVAVGGISERELPEELRDSLDALVGQALGSAAAEQVEARLRKALPDRRVSRRIARGSRTGTVRLTFEVESERWLRFDQRTSEVVYHSKHGWGSLLEVPIGARSVRVTPIIALGHNDDLIEEFSGFGLRLESRRLGTDRLGASFEWTRFDASWEPATLSAAGADPRVPGPYDSRTTVMPRVTFALTRDLSVSGGVSITELDPLTAADDSRMANAAILSVAYDRRWRRDGETSHRFQAGYSLRAGTEALEGDLDYRRHIGRLFYQFRRDDHRVIATAMGGGISGTAPLFERFTLGDSETLRGWNKYDIAPLGGERMFHGSLEYRYHDLALFLDGGSVWDRDAEARVRVSAGAGIHNDGFFMTVGFPLNTDDLRAVFTLGVRFSRPGIARF